MKTFIVLPTYNEAQNLTPLVQEILALSLQEPQLLIIDDNSQDGTGRIADQLRDSNPVCVQVIHRDGKLGLGTAYVTGFERALAQGADAVIQMDCDFSHSPRYLPKFLESIHHHDVIVGSRYIPGGKLDPRWSAGRRFLSVWANSIWVRFALGTQVRDTTAGFKCWSRRGLQSIPFSDVCSNGYVFQVEMAYLSELCGLRILEYPIYFEDRRIGRSKMSVNVKLEAALRTFEIRWRYRGRARQRARVEWQRET